MDFIGILDPNMVDEKKESEFFLVLLYAKEIFIFI